MLNIKCPWCGERPEVEFRCGGESHIQRPGPHTEVSDEAWANYLFYRDNPKGVLFERWVHSGGCGEWFNVARNTVTHEILAVYQMTDPKPVLEDPKE
ncbi:MAG: sarcosine oxidase subunit delta [Henriciella sp.]|nr:sarcosine oxidase subunit delta [Henriciella sp.]